MKPKSKLDLDELKKELLEMKYWHPIWKVVKDVGTKNGWWKNQPRGNPKKGYAMAKRGKQ